MTEAFLHYIWKHKLFDNKELQTTEGEKIEIITTGQHNTNSGPDFLDARLRINNTLWAGNIEIHKNASDWHKHRHHTNPAYENVVLHVVSSPDCKVSRSNGSEIPTLQLQVNEQLEANYKSLLLSDNWIACQTEIGRIDTFNLRFWVSQLAVIRLERKTQETEINLLRNTNSWEETFYQQLARAFGFGLNSAPFEQLARSLPLNILAKNRNNLSTVEALLFGQAGFLSENVSQPDAYYKLLKEEYTFLQKKYKLQALEKHQWKFLRLRPGNFPTVRIAQFAKLVHTSQQLFSKTTEASNTKQLLQLLEADTSTYWQTHYTFGKESKKRTKTLGKSALFSILINSVVPILFAYGRYLDNSTFQERAMQFLESLPPEKNSMVQKWNELGIETQNAADTQAVIELKNEFCNKKRCLYCSIGNKLITR